VWDSTASKQLGLRGHCWLRVTPTELSILARDDWQAIVAWPLAHIKK
jgi:hypothetical protein